MQRTTKRKQQINTITHARIIMVINTDLCRFIYGYAIKLSSVTMKQAETTSEKIRDTDRTHTDTQTHTSRYINKHSLKQAQNDVGMK